MSLLNRSDQYTLEMRMDHKQFESGVSTTLSALDKLKSALKLSDAGKGIDDLSEKANKFSLGGIQSAVENVSNRFSALGIVAMTALENITNKAVDAGERIIKALTLDPVMTGFEEYELKIDSIKTILANTNGKYSTKEVQGIVKTMDDYADDTIYSAQQMMSAIARMSAQGIDPLVSQDVIMGFANLAAMVGAGSEKFNNALNYSLVQAFSAGSMKLQDWRTLENAGISTKVFRDELIATAEEMGYFDRQWTSATGQTIAGWALLEDANRNIRETLKWGWMDTDVLTKTLAKFNDASTELGSKAIEAAREVRTVTKLKDALLESLQTGWSETWNYIIGDIDEATKVLTKINDALSSIFNKSADERNAAFKKWHDSPINGRETFITSIEKIWDYLSKIATLFDHVKDVVFGDDRLYKTLSGITEWLDEFAYSLDWNTEKSSKFYNIFYGAMSVVDIVLNTLSAWFRILSPLLEPIGEVLGFIFDKLAIVGEKIATFNREAKANDAYYKTLKSILDIVKKLLSPVTTLIDKVLGIKGNNLSEKISSLKDRLKPLTTNLAKAKEAFSGFFSSFAAKEIANFDKVSGFFDKISGALKTIATVAKKLISKGISALQSLISDVIGNFSNLDGGDAASLFNAGALILLVYNPAKKFFDRLKDLADTGKDIASSFTGILDQVRDCLKTFQEQIKAKIIKTIAVAVALLAGSIVALTMVDQDKIANAIITIGALMTELVIAMAALKLISIDRKMATSITKLAGGMVKLAAAVLILAIAMKQIADLEWTEMAKGLVGIGGILLELVGVSVLLSANNTKMATGSLGLILLAASIKILAGVVESLGQVDFTTLVKGLLSVGAVLAELGVFLTFTDFTGFGVLKGVGLLLVAESLNVLSNVLKNIAKLKPEMLVKSLVSIGALLAELGVFLTATDFNGLGVLRAAGIFVVAESLNVLANVLSKLGGLATGDLIKGLAGIGGLLLELGVALTFMQATVGGSFALLIAAAALNVLSGIVKKLGELPIETIAKGLITIAGALAIFGVAAALLGPLALPLAAVSGAILLLGAAIAVVGGGLLVISAGLTALSVALPALASGLVTTLTVLANGIPTIIATFIASILNGIKTIGTIILDMATTIIDWFKENLPKVGGLIVSGITTLWNGLKTVFSTIITAIWGWIQENVPKFFSWILEKITGFGAWFISIFTNIGGWLQQKIPLIVEWFTTNIAKLPGIIAEKFEELKQAGGELILNIITGILEKKDELVESARTMISNWLGGIAEKIELIKSNGMAIVSNVITGIADKKDDLINSAKTAVTNWLGGIAEKIETIRNNGMAIVSNVITGIADKKDDLIESAKNMVGNWLSGIVERINDLKNSGIAIVNNIISGITDSVTNFATALKNMVIEGLNSIVTDIGDSLVATGKNIATGISNGISEGVNFVKNGAMALGNAVVSGVEGLLQIESPSKVMEADGKYVVLGLVNGLIGFASKAGNAAKYVGQQVLDTMGKPLDLLGNLIDSDMSYSPVITPVIDMSNVESGIGRINAMAGQTNLLFKGISADSINGVGKITMDYTSGFDDLHNDINELHKAMQDSMRESGTSMALLRDEVNNFAANMQSSLSANGSGVSLLREDVNRFASNMQTSMAENGNRMNVLRDDVNLFASNMQTTMTENGNSVNLLRGDINTYAANAQNAQPNTDNMALLNDIATLMNKYFPEFASRQVVLDTGAMVGEMTPMFDSRMRKIVNRGR